MNLKVRIGSMLVLGGLKLTWRANEFAFGRCCFRCVLLAFGQSIVPLQVGDLEGIPLDQQILQRLTLILLSVRRPTKKRLRKKRKQRRRQQMKLMKIEFRQRWKTHKTYAKNMISKMVFSMSG